MYFPTKNDVPPLLDIVFPPYSRLFYKTRWSLSFLSLLLPSFSSQSTHFCASFQSLTPRYQREHTRVRPGQFVFLSYLGPPPENITTTGQSVFSPVQYYPQQIFLRIGLLVVRTPFSSVFRLSKREKIGWNCLQRMGITAISWFFHLALSPPRNIVYLLIFRFFSHFW